MMVKMTNNIVNILGLGFRKHTKLVILAFSEIGTSSIASVKFN